MAKSYRVTFIIRLLNFSVRTLIQMGIGPKGMYMLAVKGRKTGKLYSTPVLPIEDGADRWLVSPYGEVNWVRNARVTGQVTLTRGRESETVSIVEVGPEEGAPVLKTYINQEAIIRPYFDVEPDAPLGAFVAEAPRHPVFRIEGIRT